MSSASSAVSNAASSSSSSPLVIPSKLWNLIGGERKPPINGQYLSNLNPATNELLCEIPRSSSADIDSACRAARQAFPMWAGLSFEVRAKYLELLADGLEKRLESFAEIESRDSGKPMSWAARVEIPRAVANFRFFAGAVRHDQQDAHAMQDAINYSMRTPVGVAGLITPWNLPLYLLTWKVAPALAMGNTIVAKPSEITPLTAHFLGEVAMEIGLPAGVLNFVHGLGPEAGQSLLEHPEVNLISFTGGTVTGRRVASTAAPLFKKLSLELGGKNSSIVFADCDFDSTVKDVLRSCFSNQGQICLCGSRLLIERPIFDRFMAALLVEVQKLKIGNPTDKSTEFGSLSSLMHREKIESYVKLARDDGGKFLCGGKRPESLPEPFTNGAFYEPTIITGLPIDHRCSVEEIFGPVVIAHPFDTEAEAVAIANGTKYGLAGACWTSNVFRIQRIARTWETGMIWFNCWLHRDLRVPFGGIKESGIGTEGGKHSLEFYSNTRNICIHNGSGNI